MGGGESCHGRFLVALEENVQRLLVTAVVIDGFSRGQWRHCFVAIAVSNWGIIAQLVDGLRRL